jgi:hypothetical protein
MATTKDLINKTLRGIRQFALIIPAATSSTTDDYLLLILQFVNEAKEEIEESGWPWQALRQTVTLTLAASTVEYTLTSAGDADVDTNDRSRLLYENVTDWGSAEGFFSDSASLPMVFDTTDSSEERLIEITQERMERLHFTDNDETGQPRYFTIYSSGSALKAKVWPTPDATYTVKLRVYIPQAELASTDLTTTLSIPARPVYLRATFKANEERGSELGKEGSALYLAMLDAQGAATGKEQTPADQTVFLSR